MKKCIFCKGHVEDNSVIDFCDRCGVGVWGGKMFAAIKKNMEDARNSGDLNQGSVTDTINASYTKTLSKRSF